MAENDAKPRRKPPPPPPLGKKRRTRDVAKADGDPPGDAEKKRVSLPKPKAPAARKPAALRGSAPKTPLPKQTPPVVAGDTKVAKAPRRTHADQPPRAATEDSARKGNLQGAVSGEVGADELDLDDLLEEEPTPAVGAIQKPLATIAIPDETEPRHSTLLDAYAEDAKLAIAEYEEELIGEKDTLRLGRLHYEIARLNDGILGNRDVALKHFAKSLAATPEFLPAVVGARAVMIETGKYAPALELFDRELRVTADRGAKAALMFAKARVLEDRLRKPQEAREVYAAAGELLESDPQQLKALEQTDFMLGDHKQLAQTYKAAANAVAQDRAHRAALVARRARLVEVHEKDRDAAAELYEAALGVDLATSGALEALKRLHYGRGRWRELVRVLEREADAADDAGVRTIALYRIGLLLADRLGNRKEAIAYLERAAAVEPVQVVVLEALTRLYEASGAQSQLAATLSRLVQQTSDARTRLGYLQRIGEICGDVLKDDDAAVRAYEAALKLDATYIPALRAVASLYADRHEWDKLVQMHEAEATAVSDTGRRAAAHARSGEILERLGRRIEATGHYEHALALEPDQPASFRALIRLYGRAEEHHKLVELYERAIERVDVERKMEYLFAVGDLFRGPLDDPEQAEHAYKRILRLKPDHLGAMHALQRASEAAGRDQQLVEALELEAKTTDDSREIVALLHRAAEIRQEQLGQRAEAVALFKKVLELDGQHPPTLASLGRIYHAEGHWNDLVDIFSRELQVEGDGPGAVALLYRMGDVQARFLAQPTEAISCFRRALDIDPEHSPSAQGLARILRDKGDWKTLVELMQAEQRQHPEEWSQALAAFRSGEILEDHLGDKAAAERSYVEALNLASDHRPAIDALARVRTELENWLELAEQLTDIADASTDRKLSIDSLLRAGEVYWDHLESAGKAIGCYNRVLELDPDHLGALLALEPLYRKVQSWPELAAVYARQVVVMEDPGAKVAALVERARILEVHRTGAPDDLIDCYTAILALRPADRAALVGLERLAAHSGDARVMASVAARLAMASPEPELKSSFLTRQAESLEIGGGPQALEIYREALSLDRHNRSALRGLARLAEVLGDGAAMVEAARRAAETAKDPETAAAALVRSGLVNVERIGNRDAAIEDFETALAKWPDHAPAAEQLSAHLRARGDHEVLVERLSRAANEAKKPERQSELWIEVGRLYADDLGNLGAALSGLKRLTGAQPRNPRALLELSRLLAEDRRYEEAIVLLKRCLSLKPDDEVALTANYLLATCHEETDDAKAAFKHYEVALDLSPDDRELLGRVVALQMKAKLHAAAADTASRLLMLAESDDERVDALITVARAKVGTNRGTDSVVLLAEAVAIQGPAGTAGAEVRRLATDPEQWNAYAEALLEHLRQAPPDRRAPLYQEIAKVQSDRLNASDSALRTLVDGLRVCAGDASLRFELAKRLRQAGRLGEAIEQFQYLLMDDAVRIEAWRYLAQSYQEAGRTRERQMTLAALAVLEEASAGELDEVRGWRPRTTAVPPGALTPSAAAELLIGADQQAPAAGLLDAMCDGLGKVRPADLGAYGVGGRDKIPQRSDHPLRALCDHVAGAFGIEEFELYVHRQRDTGVVAETTSKPTLLVPVWLHELPRSQQVFLVARSLFNVARGVHAIDLMTPRDVDLLLTAAARTAAPRFGERVAPADVLDDRQRQIMRGLPRRKRKVFESAVDVYLRSGGVDASAFVQWAQQSARRVALLLSDDVVGSITAIVRTEDLGSKRGIAMVRDSPVVADLLKVWVSKSAMSLRQRCALLPPSS